LTSQRIRLAILHRNSERLLRLRVQLLPFIECVGRHQAAPVLDGFSECWCCGDRLRLRVDRTKPNLRVFCPERVLLAKSVIRPILQYAGRRGWKVAAMTPTQYTVLLPKLRDPALAQGLDRREAAYIRSSVSSPYPFERACAAFTVIGRTRTVRRQKCLGGGVAQCYLRPNIDRRPGFRSKRAKIQSREC
jgi:hypothetical protein